MFTNPLSLYLELVSGAAMPHPAHPAWHGWLTDAELDYCARLERAEEHLGARVLAKRTAARALGWPHETPWEDVEILREPWRPPVVALRGRLETWRREHDLPVPGVSLTHAAGQAAATAWLPGDPGPGEAGVDDPGMGDAGVGEAGVDDLGMGDAGVGDVGVDDPDGGPCAGDA